MVTKKVLFVAHKNKFMIDYFGLIHFHSFYVLLTRLSMYCYTLFEMELNELTIPFLFVLTTLHFVISPLGITRSSPGKLSPLLKCVDGNYKPQKILGLGAFAADFAYQGMTIEVMKNLIRTEKTQR